MSEISNTLADAARLQAKLGAEKRLQAVRWLVVGAGVGLAAIITFCAQQCDPAYTMRTLLPAYFAFAASVITGWLGLFVESLRHTALEEHLACSHNRDQYSSQIDKSPEMFSSPPSLAENGNAKRNELIKSYNTQHERAEIAWTWVNRYTLATKISVAVAAISLAAGVFSPTYFAFSNAKLIASDCARNQLSIGGK